MVPVVKFPPPRSTEKGRIVSCSTCAGQFRPGRVGGAGQVDEVARRERNRQRGRGEDDQGERGPDGESVVGEAVSGLALWYVVW